MTSVTPSWRARSALTYGSNATSCMPNARRTLRDEHADAAEADDAERLAVQLDALPARAVPRARLEVGVGLRDVAGLREQQRDRVLGRRQHVRLRRVHHHHAAPGGGLDVDVVETDPGATDDHELAPGVEHRFVTWVALRITSAAAPTTASSSSSAPGRCARRPRARRRASHRVRARRALGDEHAARLTRSRVAVADLATVPGSQASSVRDAADALAEVVVAERERKARVAGRAERLPGHDGDLACSRSTSTELERCRRDAAGISRPSTPSKFGKQ